MQTSFISIPTVVFDHRPDTRYRRLPLTRPSTPTQLRDSNIPSYPHPCSHLLTKPFSSSTNLMVPQRVHHVKGCLEIVPSLGISKSVVKSHHTACSHVECHILEDAKPYRLPLLKADHPRNIFEKLSGDTGHVVLENLQTLSEREIEIGKRVRLQVVTDIDRLDSLGGWGDAKDESGGAVRAGEGPVE